jgi:hypothetical protein
MTTMKRILLLSALALAGARARAATTCPQDTWAGSIWNEYQAANVTNSGAFSTGTANGESYWTTTGNNTSDNTAIPTAAASGFSDFSFTIGPADVGYYKIEALVQAPDTNSDSFFVGIVGQNDSCSGGGGSSGSPAIRRWDVEETAGATWTWRYVTDWNNSNSFGNARVWYLTAGTYTLRFIGREANARLARVHFRRLVTAPSPTPTPIVTPPALGTGLYGSYFKNNNLTNLGGTRTDATVDFNWGTGNPGFGLGNSNFSVRWCGQIEFPLADNYILYANKDDGARIWLDGVLILDQWTSAPAEYASSAIAVAASGKHDIIIEYWENTGSAQMHLSWASGAITKTVVPQGRLNSLAGGCGSSGNSPTPTPSPVAVGSSPTPTQQPSFSPTPAVTVWAGLPAAKRLNGLEYIPFPEGKKGSVIVYPLSVTFSSAAANNTVRNTARWRITFSGLASTIGGQVQVETRLGSIGEACTTGSMEPSAYSSATSLSLPQRPANLSSTYFWVNSPVPYTERFDALGDPRYVPYADTVGAPGNNTDPQGSYNWYFKDMTDSTFPDYQPEYAPFLPMAVNTRYNGQPNFDVPRLFSLWRESVIASRSIYTSMTGYSSYYIGLGGEIGGDSSNKLSSGGVPCYSGPWGAGGSGGKEEIIGSASLVRTGTWLSRPELGELWPDALYSSDWYNGGSNASWGNLRNNQQGGQAYRQAMQSLGAAAYSYPQVQHRNQAPGCATFLNGSGGSAQFNHFTNQFNASLLYDGSRMASDYNFSMPATFNVTRSWGLVQGGNQPPEWNQWPYKDRRIALDIYSAAASQPATTWGFYQRDGGTLASQRASAAVRGVDSTGIVDPAGNPAAGWFVINGLAPSTDSGINFVARFAILSCLRTFHDAGAPTVTGSWGGQGFTNSNNKVGPNTFRIQQVPLVQITQPKVGQDVSGLATLVLQWKTRSARWDRARYTENYPCLDADQAPCSAGDPTKPEDPAREWHDDAALVYNIKYSMNGGKDWTSALSPRVAQPGVYLDGVDSIPANPSNTFQYNWDVSALPPGNKLVRVEAYRQALGLHYAYHEMTMKTAP